MFKTADVDDAVLTGALRASEIPLSPKIFSEIQNLMYSRFGIAFSDKKRDLVISRLADRLRKLEMRSYDEYFRFVTSDRSGKELSAMVDALTTNFTSLFREKEHFDYLEKAVLPELISKNSIAFWSAGCATGEEPYSIACWLAEHLGNRSKDIRILATDISGRALKAAERAIYEEERFKGLSDPWRRRYLLKGTGRWRNMFQFKPEIRRMIQFSYLNLNEPFPSVGIFDVIFCRNVMIYFDQTTRDRLISRLAEHLCPGGHFLPGHAESLAPELHGMRRVSPAVYRKTL
jgi:chemotaxis protein methyltransferase CheR